MGFEMDTRAVVEHWQNAYQFENVSYEISVEDGLTLYARLGPEHWARIEAQDVPIESLVTSAEMKVCMGRGIPLSLLPKTRLTSVDPLVISGSAYVIDMFLQLLFGEN